MYVVTNLSICCDCNVTVAQVIVGMPYDTSADMWSLACIVFELLTGDLLFDPR